MDILGSIDQIVSQSPALAFLAVFAGGLLSAANPCVLVTIPLVIGYVGGYASESRMKAFTYTLAFVFGLSMTFTALGMIAALAGTLFGNVGDWWKYVVAVIVTVMGLALLGIIPLPQAHLRQPGKKGLLGSFLLGLLFGVVSSPCATPVLAVILMLVSRSGQALYGGALLFVYALGHCALMLVAGTFTGMAATLIESKGLERFSVHARRVSGVVIIAVGVYLVL